MIYNQFIVEIDENTDFDNLPEDQQVDIVSAHIHWPEGVMLGTGPVLGKTLLLIATTAKAEEIEAMIELHSLSWEVLAVEGVQVDQSLLLPYYLDRLIYDSDGEHIGDEPVTDLTGKIQTFAGKQWTY